MPTVIQGNKVHATTALDDGRQGTPPSKKSDPNASRGHHIPHSGAVGIILRRGPYYGSRKIDKKNEKMQPKGGTTTKAAERIANKKELRG